MAEYGPESGYSIIEYEFLVACDQKIAFWRQDRKADIRRRIAILPFILALNAILWWVHLEISDQSVLVFFFSAFSVGVVIWAAVGSLEIVMTKAPPTSDEWIAYWRKNNVEPGEAFVRVSPFKVEVREPAAGEYLDELVLDGLIPSMPPHIQLFDVEERVNELEAKKREALVRR